VALRGHPRERRRAVQQLPRGSM